jgi:hypothetical protein
MFPILSLFGCHRHILLFLPQHRIAVIRIFGRWLTAVHLAQFRVSCIVGGDGPPPCRVLLVGAGTSPDTCFSGGRLFSFSVRVACHDYVWLHAQEPLCLREEQLVKFARAREVARGQPRGTTLSFHLPAGAIAIPAV